MLQLRWSLLCALSLMTFPGAHAYTEFYDTGCKLRAQRIYQGLEPNPWADEFDVFYDGIPRGLINKTLALNRTSLGETPYVRLTRPGCKALCTDQPDLHDVDEAFQILTTWVLPILALLSSLPYESLHTAKTQRTLAALVNWIGSPQSAITTTMFNIHQMRDCRNRIIPGRLRQQSTDAFFVLSCINQYLYERYKKKKEYSPFWAKQLENKRNRALFYGLLRPLSTPVEHRFVEPTVGEPSISEHDITKSTLPEHENAEPAIAEHTNTEPHDVHETRVLLANLAFELRLLRRRSVYPMILNIAWFFLAFVLSLVLAFANLGSNTESHNLGLGIGMTWLPAFVFMTAVDRNPTLPERCGALIERWLYNVNAIYEFDNGRLVRGTNDDVHLKRLDRIYWWHPNIEVERKITVDAFVGQGRRLRHCGITNTVLERLDHPRAPYWDEDSGTTKFMGHDVGPGQSVMANGWNLEVLMAPTRPTGNDDIEMQNGLQKSTTREAVRNITRNGRSRYNFRLEKAGPGLGYLRHDNTSALWNFLAADFELDIIKRPVSWWICWACSGLFVGISVGMAFMLAYNTPQIGFGCRSLAWLLFWLLSSVSWTFQAIFQEPPVWVRRVSTVINALSFCWLMAYMLIQVMNGFNSCTCRTDLSTFGAGYMDFENAEFYKKNYHVVTWWAVASTIGPLGGLVPILWTMRRWTRNSELWRVHEVPDFPVEQLNPPIAGRPWDGDPMAWLR